MLIEHKVKRPGGSDHRIDGTTYEFREDKEGRHVCEVKNAEHAKRFLSISTFEKVGGKPSAETNGQQADGGTGDAPADDGADAPTDGKDDGDLADMSKAELLAIAKDAGLEVDGRAKKETIIAAIEATEG